MLEDEQVNILWDFKIQVDWHLEHNTPDRIKIEDQNVSVSDTVTSGDARVNEKELGKNDKILSVGSWNHTTMDETY